MGSTGGDPPFFVGIDRQGSTAVVRVGGDIDLQTAPRFRDALLAAVHATEGDIAVDVSAVRFMDSQGVHAIATALEALPADSRRITLERPTPAVRRLLEIVQLDNYVTIEGA